MDDTGRSIEDLQEENACLLQDLQVCKEQLKVVAAELNKAKLALQQIALILRQLS